MKALEGVDIQGPTDEDGDCGESHHKTGDVCQSSRPQGDRRGQAAGEISSPLRGQLGIRGQGGLQVQWSLFHNYADAPSRNHTRDIDTFLPDMTWRWLNRQWREIHQIGQVWDERPAQARLDDDSEDPSGRAVS